MKILSVASLRVGDTLVRQSAERTTYGIVRAIDETLGIVSIENSEGVERNFSLSYLASSGWEVVGSHE